MRIHREGIPTLVLIGVVALLLNLLVAGLAPAGLWLTLPVLLLMWGFFAQFFRNPLRQTPLGADAIISPADGTIVAIERIIETEYFHDERLKISIYMSALNVHCNRVPCNGQVVYTRYHAGKYLVAFHPKASDLNERNTVVFRDSAGREVLTRQIAGLLARRIVSYMRVGASVQAGQELGFIKFGSRCDVFLPVSAQVPVQLQQRVTGGETVLAHLPPS